jgi:hypothetical protein
MVSSFNTPPQRVEMNRAGCFLDGTIEKTHDGARAESPILKSRHLYHGFLSVALPTCQSARRN